MRKFWISFIALLMGVVIGVGIWHGIAYKDKLESFAKESWDKIKSVFVKKDNNQPTPNEEQFSLDGLYYINVNGDYSFVQIRDYSPETQTGSYGIVGGYMKDSQVCLFKGWESRIEVDSIRIVEDDKYLHLLYQNSNEIECQIMIYDKASKTLYYDFSNGDQFPGETYEEQLLSAMTPFTEFIVVECQHVVIMDMTKTQPTCTEPGLKENWCYDCNKFLGTETLPALGHDYVDGKCTRCGESDPNYVEVCEHDWVEDLSYVPAVPSCGEYWDTQYKCSKCNETKLETNGPLQHDYVDCICSRCGVTNHTFDAGVCTSCNALDEEFYSNFCGYWFTETTGFDVEGFSRYYFLIEKDGDNYYFTRSGYKVEDGKIILYNNSTDYGSRQSFTFTASNYLGSTPLISGFTLTRQETIFNGCYDGSQLSVGDMIFIKTDKEIYLDGSSAPVTPM